MGHLLLLCLFIFAESCATLSPQGKQLKVIHDVRAVENCQFVGQVASNSGFSVDLAMTLIGNHDSDVILRNQAAELGDTLLLTKNDSGIVGSNRSGHVYICGNAASHAQRLVR